MTSRVLPILALLFAVAIFFVYVQPLWSGPIATAKAAIASADAALAAADDYQNRKDQLAHERSAIEPADLARLEAFLPDSVDNVGMIIDLNALAARSRLSLVNINVARAETKAAENGQTSAPAGPGAPVGPGGIAVVSGESPVGSVELDMSVIGTYEAFQEFLGSVEKSERLLDVKDLTITGSDTGVYTYHMKLSLYWLR